MLYLVDANSIINAKDIYYPLDRVPEYWDWLLHHATSGNLKIPLEIYEEVHPGTKKDHPFHSWRKNNDTTSALVLDEEPDLAILQDVIDKGYGPNVTDAELITIGKDPFLIAYALTSVDRIVVTSEISKPTATRSKRRIPDVCKQFGLTCITPFQLNELLDFRTNWKR